MEWLVRLDPILYSATVALARRLVTGVDIWLNTPRYPLEASGTSGMKAGINGVLAPRARPERQRSWARTSAGEQPAGSEAGPKGACLARRGRIAKILTHLGLSPRAPPRSPTTRIEIPILLFDFDAEARYLGRSAVLPLLIAGLLLLPSTVSGEEPSLPPGERPVKVHAGFFLVNLSGVSERSETFDADLYLNFRWQDSRLAFHGFEPRRFLEDAAVGRLEEMWWPQLEFVNTAEPKITNRALEISPDGSVRYEIGMTSKFRADLDLRRFPFDRQTLEVRIESFLWTDDQMVFVPDSTRIGFNPDSTFEGLGVTRATAEIRRSQLAGWGTTFSEFVVQIDVRREAGFYVWTILVPVILIFLISCTVFAVHIENFADRVGISLTALLACIATQFAISFSLPQISYLTVIDRVFLVTYCCIALGVLISTLQAALLGHDHERAARVDRLAGLCLPALFLALLALCMLW